MSVLPNSPGKGSVLMYPFPYAPSYPNIMILEQHILANKGIDYL